MRYAQGFAASGIAMPHFSPDQIAQYQRDGYIVPDWKIPAEQLAHMRAALDRLLQANAHLTSDNLICPHLPHAGVQGLRGSYEWLGYAGTSGIVERVAELVGDDLILWGTTLFGKPAGVGKATPWHQDGQYWPIKPLATCTAWIALDDCKLANGCLRVLPGSHQDQRLRRHNTNPSDALTLNQELDASEIDEGHACDLELQAGQMVLFDVYLVHGSQPNRSAERRAGFVCRYMPAAARFDHEWGRDFMERSGIVDFSGRALYQVHGSNSGANDLQCGHDAGRDGRHWRELLN